MVLKEERHLLKGSAVYKLAWHHDKEVKIKLHTECPILHTV